MKIAVDFDDTLFDSVLGWLGSKNKSRMWSYELSTSRLADLLDFLNKATLMLDPVPGVLRFLEVFNASVIVITKREGKHLELAKQCLKNLGYGNILVYNKSDYPEVDVIIDDYPVGYDLKAKKIFLFSQPWNARDVPSMKDKYERIFDWDVLTDMLSFTSNCLNCGSYMLSNCKEDAKRCIGCGLVIKH